MTLVYDERVVATKWTKFPGTETGHTSTAWAVLSLLDGWYIDGFLKRRRD